jgi:hypothetical protein
MNASWHHFLPKASHEGPWKFSGYMVELWLEANREKLLWGLDYLGVG